MSSILPIGLSILGLAESAFFNLGLLQARSIGGIVADITVEEHHFDKITITDHPVETGTPISDHMYPHPFQCTVKVGFSNSSMQAGLNPAYVNQAYGSLQALQQSREPFDLITGKRYYTNMVLENLVAETDEKMAFSGIFTCECRSILLVETTSTTVPPANVQQDPQSTAAPVQRGTVAATPALQINVNALPAELRNQAGP